MDIYQGKENSGERKKNIRIRRKKQKKKNFQGLALFESQNINKKTNLM